MLSKRCQSLIGGAEWVFRIRVLPAPGMRKSDVSKTLNEPIRGKADRHYELWRRRRGCNCLRE